MANLYENIPEMDAQARANEQKRRIAEAMMAQGMEAQTPYTPAGKYVVPMSWTQGAAKIAQAMLGAYGMRKASQDEQALAKQLQDKQQQTVAAYQDSLKQGPSVVPPALSPEGNASIDPEQRWQGPTDQQVTDDRRAKLIQFLTNQYAPESAKQAAVLGENWNREDANSAANRELLRQNKLDELTFRAEQLKATSENTRLSIEARADAARQHDETLRAIAAMSAASKPQPAPSYTSIVDPKDPTRLLTIDGRIYQPGGTLGDPGVIGIAGKEPASAKAEETRGTGKKAVDEQVANLRDLYSQLDEGGGIVDPDKGTLANAKAWTASSGPGQFLGRIAGTKNQSARNQIAQQRPLLLRAIMSATGMSARSLDSNTELKLWLAAATDPTLDVAANRAALDNIERQYGSAAVGKTAAPAPAAVPPGTALKFDAQGNPVQ